MALPSPVALLKKAASFLRKFSSTALEIFFSLLIVIILTPSAQWAAIVVGVAFLFFKHWWFGIVLIALGIVTKNIRH